MKMNKILLTLALGIASFASLQAQVEVTITGSTAFRSISFDRIPVLFDAPSLVQNVTNSNLPGVNNITRDQALLLMTATGPGLMPDTFLGGTTGNTIYLIGRDSGSGSRISVEKDIGFVGSPTLWATNSAGQFITTNGFSSGGLVAGALKLPNTIGYVGLGDFNNISNNAVALSFNGVPYSATTVQNGSSGLECLEHLVSR